MKRYSLTEDSGCGPLYSEIMPLIECADGELVYFHEAITEMQRLAAPCGCRDGLHAITDYVDSMGIGDSALLLLGYSALMRAIRSAANCRCNLMPNAPPSEQR